MNGTGGERRRTATSRRHSWKGRSSSMSGNGFSTHGERLGWSCWRRHSPVGVSAMHSSTLHQLLRRTWATSDASEGWQRTVPSFWMQPRGKSLQVATVMYANFASSRYHPRAAAEAQRVHAQLPAARSDGSGKWPPGARPWRTFRGLGHLKSIAGSDGRPLGAGGCAYLTCPNPFRLCLLLTHSTLLAAFHARHGRPR